MTRDVLLRKWADLAPGECSVFSFQLIRTCLVIGSNATQSRILKLMFILVWIQCESLRCA